MPVRPLPELLFDGGLTAVDLPPMGPNVLSFEYPNAEVEPRPMLRDGASEVLSYKLHEKRSGEQQEGVYAGVK